jgi:adenylate cyclase
VATLQSHELLQWLDDIYGTFDRLIDMYDEAINKIETVGGVYLVSCGLPVWMPQHSITLAQFCADVMDLCENINGSRVNYKIGINSGPVTAGVIGRSRQFYRVFGDTINGASIVIAAWSLHACVL